jgi:hypothetical protein
MMVDEPAADADIRRSSKKASNEFWGTNRTQRSDFSLLVKGLHFATTSQNLLSLFNCALVEINYDESGRSTGEAVLYFETASARDASLLGMRNPTVDGVAVTLEKYERPIQKRYPRLNTQKTCQG